MLHPKVNNQCIELIITILLHHSFKEVNISKKMQF